MKLLFVCTGNTCRSPLAEVIARAEATGRGLPQVEVASAGTFAFPGSSAAGPGIAVAAAHGLDLGDHAARELSLDLAEWADVIIGMDASHVELAAKLDPGTVVHLLTDFLPPGDPRSGRGVPDPYGGDLDTYAATFDVLQLAIGGLFDALVDPDLQARR